MHTFYKKALFSLFTTVIFIPQTSFGQGFFSPQNASNEYSSFGIGGGSTHYIGDLTPIRYIYYTPYTNVRWNGQLNYTRYVAPQLGFRAAFTWARIAGDDFTYGQRNTGGMASSLIRNLHFRNDIKEFTIQAILNLKPQYNKGIAGRSTWMPYLATGIGFIAHNPQARGPVDASTGAITNWVNLRSLSTEGQNLPGIDTPTYSLVQLVAPLSLGIRYKATDNLDIAFEAGIRISTTDHLDDVSGRPFVDPTIIEANRGALARDVAYRSTEQFHALSGQDRTGIVLAATGVSNLASLANVYGFNKGSQRGSNARFYHKIDMYMVTQLTLSYVIGHSIKCPPVL